jgi:hypothetical protein
MHDEARPRHGADTIARLSGDSLVLLHAASGGYFTLDLVGARIWELCDGSRSIAEIVGVMHEEFDAPVDVLDADVRRLLEELVGERLLAGESA